MMKNSIAHSINKKALWFLKLSVLFITAGFSTHLYAQDGIVYLDATSINNVSCTDTDCFFPEKSLVDQDVYIQGQIDWDNDKNLVLHTRGNIVFTQGAKITGKRDGSIILKAGMDPQKIEQCKNAVFFSEEDNIQIEMLGLGKVKIYYHPVPKEKDDDKYNHKYHNPKSYFYEQHIKVRDYKYFSSYMLVNNVYDLENIVTTLHNSFALSRNINAAGTKEWYDSKGFDPIKSMEKKYGESGRPFSGD